MSNKKKVFYVLLILAYCSIIMIGYWESMFFTDTENNLKHEYRVGAAMTINLLSPFWLGAPIMALITKKNLLKAELISSFIPAAIIVLLILSWGF